MTTDHGPLNREPRNVRPPFDVYPPEFSDSADLRAALLDAIGPDVELGDHDRRIITWLAGWDVGTVGTVASLFHRVRETNRGEVPREVEPVIWRVTITPEGHEATIGNEYRQIPGVWQVHIGGRWVPSSVWSSLAEMTTHGYTLTEVPAAKAHAAALRAHSSEPKEA